MVLEENLRHEVAPGWDEHLPWTEFAMNNAALFMAIQVFIECFNNSI